MTIQIRFIVEEDEKGSWSANSLAVKLGDATWAFASINHWAEHFVLSDFCIFATFYNKEALLKKKTKGRRRKYVMEGGAHLGSLVPCFPKNKT